MRLWLIKLGKVLNAMKRDGFLHGMTKAFHGLFALVRTMYVPAGDILIVTSGIGDSARYRGHHVAEELRHSGFRVSVTVQDNPFLSLYVKKFKVFVFHRVLYIGRARSLYDNAKKFGKTIIFETDDLVYDPKFLIHMDFYNQMQLFEKLQYKDGVGGEMVADPYVRVATVTTSFLAEKLRKEGKEVFIVSNKLSDADVAVASTLYTEKRAEIPAEIKCTPIVTIGYFSGVISHNKDFAILTPVFVTLFEKYPHLRVVIYGPLDVDSALTKYKDRFMQNTYVPREKHFANISAVDINIAPLEQGNPFCESKSELKFFEAGIVGVPTVATATQTFSEAITQGIDGFVANNTDEWIEYLSIFIKSSIQRQKIGDEARATAQKRYTTHTHNTAYETYLRKQIVS